MTKGGETEVKDIQKTMDELENYLRGMTDHSNYFGMIGKFNKIRRKLNQLDEPETLSQELPVIPKFMAEWIEKYVEYGYDLYPALKKMENNARSWERIYDWYRNNTLEFVLAYLTQEYEIEEEQKYYVMNNDNRMMLVRMMDGKTITEADPFKLEDMYEGEKKSHRLTEQEIKDYDERYWAFRKPVEELEE